MPLVFSVDVQELLVTVHVKKVDPKVLGSIYRLATYKDFDIWINRCTKIEYGDLHVSGAGTVAMNLFDTKTDRDEWLDGLFATMSYLAFCPLKGPRKSGTYELEAQLNKS